MHESWHGYGVVRGRLYIKGFRSSVFKLCLPFCFMVIVWMTREAVSVNQLLQPNFGILFSLFLSSCDAQYLCCLTCVFSTPLCFLKLCAAVSLFLFMFLFKWFLGDELPLALWIQSFSLSFSCVSIRSISHCRSAVVLPSQPCWGGEAVVMAAQHSWSTKIWQCNCTTILLIN